MMNNDLCPICGAYWNCDCPGMTETRLAQRMDAEFAAMFAEPIEQPRGTSGTVLTEEHLLAAYDRMSHSRYRP